MPITFDADSRTFHLRNGQVSYLIRVLENGTLGHLYFGGPLAADGSYAHLSSREFLGFSNRLGEPVALEYPTSGIGDYRVPALVVGLPVGFVGARESKLALLDSDLCYITNTSPRGGSPVAAAAVNALATWSRSGVPAWRRRRWPMARLSGPRQRQEVLAKPLVPAA